LKIVESIKNTEVVGELPPQKKSGGEERREKTWDEGCK